jgi:hypothetical protein
MMRKLLIGSVVTSGLLALSLGSAVSAVPAASAAGWSLAAATSAPQQQAVNHWVNQHGTIFHQLREGFQKALSDFDPLHFGATKHLPQDCAALHVIIVHAQALPAIPVPSTQSHWVHAVSSLDTGTNDCIKWSSSKGLDRYIKASEAEGYWTKGGVELALVATELMRAADRTSL